MTNEEAELTVLRSVGKEISQRSIAEQIGYSVGKVNYVINGLIEKGCIKAEKFLHSKHKSKYQYLLTEKGFNEKVALTEKFIQRKKAEYDKLQAELEEYKSQNQNGFISQGRAN